MGDLVVDPTPALSVHLHCAQAFVHIGEYIQAICALVLSTYVAPFYETRGVLRVFHPLVEVDFLFFCQLFSF